MTGLFMVRPFFSLPDAMSSLSRVAMDALFYLGTYRALGNTKLVVSLQAHPDLRRRAEVPAKAHSRVGGYSPLAVDDGAYAAGGDSDIAGESVDTDPHRLHKFLKEDLPRVNGFKKFLFHSSPLMVVCYFNVIGVSAFPVKAYSPLIVNPYTILPLTPTLQSLETVARGNSKVLKAPGPMKVQEFSPCNPFNRAKTGHVQIIEQRLGFGITKGPDHNKIVYYAMRNMSSGIF